MRHPECDLRRWLDKHPDAVKPYTARRISESYAYVDSVLSSFPDLPRGTAFDVGCGSGFDSFALGGEFDRVVGIDTRIRAIREARRIQRRAGIHNTSFARADVLSYRPPEGIDLIWCFIMSHFTESRSRLLERLRSALRSGGSLFYAEESEGYPARELHRAIERRDPWEARERIRQGINGLLGRPHFRFFVAGSAPPLLGRLGLEVVRRDLELWHDLPVVERVWARRVRGGEPDRSGLTGPDYAAEDPDFGETRRMAADLISRRGRGFSASQRSQIESLASRPGSRFAPFLIYLLMSDVVLRSPAGRASFIERAHRYTLKSFARPHVQWDRLLELEDSFLSSLPWHSNRDDAR